MVDTHISFYLRKYRIHIHRDMLTGLGCPQRICFMVSDDGQSLLVLPYEKRDLRSHRVPAKVYGANRHGGMEISSMGLCQIISRLHGWSIAASYRIPGKVLKEQKIAVFDLSKAVEIERLNYENDKTECNPL